MSGPVPMPAAEFDVDEDLVRRLLRSQHDDLADLPLRLVANGWDNAIYQLGSDLSVRLPRRQMGADLVAHEHRWLPELARRLPIAIPQPLRVGVPGSGYPWNWTICQWLEGDIAASDQLHRRRAAVDLGEFLAALHVAATPEAPHNPYRGVPLSVRDQLTRDRIEQLHALVPQAELLQAWGASLDVADYDGPPVWIHGDLHPANIIVSGGRISGVIDWGDMTAGDPAGDLSVAWMLFDAEDREVFRAEAGSQDNDTWARARGWAITLGIAYIASSADNPMMAAIGHRTLQRVLSE